MSSGAGHHPSPHKKPAATVPAPVSATEERQSILIIDDEKDVHYSFRRLLEKEPLEVYSAESGDEGLKLAKKHAPDLIVMDIRMGQQNGLDTLKELRQMNPKQVVVMMTAYGTSQTAIEAMKRGAYDYVLKPFDIPQLKVLLFEALAAALNADGLLIEVHPNPAEAWSDGQQQVDFDLYARLVEELKPFVVAVGRPL